MASRFTPPETGRVARYTTAAHDEIALAYTYEEGQLRGQRTTVYYPPARYAEKQAAHGTNIYPIPRPYQP